MRCEEVSLALLDEKERGAPDIEAHLATCSSCQALAEVEGAARRLRRVGQVPAMSPTDPWKEISRRRRVRLTLAAAAMIGAGVLGGVFASVRPDSAPAVASVDDAQRGPADSTARSETEPLKVGDPNVQADGEDESSVIQELLADASDLLARDPAVRDPLYASFGDLPKWVALPRDRSLDGPVFQKALFPLHVSSEVNP